MGIRCAGAVRIRGFTEHLTLGYRDAVAVTDSSLHTVGERVVGHEFHRTAVTFAESYQPALVYRDREVNAVRDGAVHRRACRLSAHPPRRAPPRDIPLVVAAATSRLAG